jgi:uncharacterized protein (DUF305 family)
MLILVVMGVLGALIQFSLAPLFSHETPVPLIAHRHVHTPVTSELDFLIQMIPHHQEAIDTSRIILETSTNPALKSLAQTIIDAQEVEIVLMNAWIDTWYPGQRYPHSYAPMMPDLARLRGDARDEAYLIGMIEHHRMAIMMASEVKAFAPRAEVAALANLITLNQNDEIRQMQDLLGSDRISSEPASDMHTGH